MVIAQLNIRSLKGHHKDLIKHCYTTNTNILCLTETHVNDYKHYKINNLPNLIHSYGTHGCAIYSTTKSTKTFHHNDIYESVTGIIDNNIITSIYIPPNTAWYKINSKLTTFLQFLNEQSNKHNCSRIIINGDFNMDKNIQDNKLFPKLQHFNLTQIINEPTQILGN